MRYEHERHSVGPLPASDMRARICYRGARQPNTACLPGRERGLTGGRRAAKSPPPPNPTPTVTTTTTALPKAHLKCGRAYSQVSIQISSSCRLVVSEFLLRNPSWLCQCHVMTISVRTRCQYEVRLSEQCIIHSMTGLSCHILCWPACYQDLLLTNLCSPAL